MDSSAHRTPSSLPLDQLVAHALSELDKINYSRRSVRRYRTVWGHLVTFSREMSLGDRYSEQLATEFVTAYRRQPGERVKANEEWRRHIPFLVKVLGDFARDGRVEHTRIETSRLQVPAAMKKSLSEYEQYARDRRHLRASTLRGRMRTIAVFLDDLESRNVATLGQLQPADITAFVGSRRRLGPRSMSRTVSDIRCFLRFLLLRGILQRDLSQMLPTVRVPRDAAIPSVWEPELVERLLTVVDRGSPRGKRDYAILLLACRLGLRLGDIRALRLDDLKWDTAAVEITQAKTGAPLCLPMTEEVGEALIDYLKSGRPQTAHRELFLMEQFVQTKQACGYRFGEGIRILRCFDRYLSAEGLLRCELPRPLTRQWLAKQPHESARTQQFRISLVRQFASYLCRLGYCAYVPDRSLSAKASSGFCPRILTHTEVQQLLQAVDQLTPTARAPLRHLVMPEVFRLLYGCGFRVNEVLHLRVADVDLDRGVLTVRQAKFGKDRLVPPALPLVQRLQRYAASFGTRPPDAFFFPSSHGGPWGLATVYWLYRELLLRCGIPHGGRGKGPRVHDLRHTMAVHSLLRWYREGADLDAKLPVLATYLGHQSLAGTQRYLHLTAELFPQISVRANAAFGDVIPRRIAS